MVSDTQEIEYLIDTQFFYDIGGEEVEKGKVKLVLNVKRQVGIFELSFNIQGNIVIACDRCLEDMNLPFNCNNRLIVKLGKEYCEESDEIIVIPIGEGVINLAWFIYEFIVLSIPIKHVHAPGKCNKEMASVLKKHTAKNIIDSDDEFAKEGDIIIITDDDGEELEQETISDPRWDGLKKLIENDNN